MPWTHRSHCHAKGFDFAPDWELHNGYKWFKTALFPTWTQLLQATIGANGGDGGLWLRGVCTELLEDHQRDGRNPMANIYTFFELEEGQLVVKVQELQVVVEAWAAAALQQEQEVAKRCAKAAEKRARATATAAAAAEEGEEVAPQAAGQVAGGAH